MALGQLASRRTAAVVGVSLAVGIAVAGLLLLRSSSDETTEIHAAIAAGPNTLVLLDSESGRPVADVALGAEPARLASGGGAFWVAAPEDGVVVRVDERTRAARRFEVGEEPYDVAVGPEAIWVPDHDLHRLFRLDPSTGKTRATEDLGAPAVAVGYAFDSVWLVVVPGDLLRIDPETLEVIHREPRLVGTMENAEPKLVPGDDTLWIASPASGSLARVADDGTPTSMEAGGILSLTVTDDGVWYSRDTGELQRLHDDDRVGVGTRPLDLSASGDELWVASYDDGEAKRVDTEALRVTGEVVLGGKPVAVATGESLVAVAVQAP